MEFYADVGSRAYVMSATTAPDPAEGHGARDSSADADQTRADDLSPAHLT